MDKSPLQYFANPNLDRRQSKAKHNES
ncbi:uncharacterized protein G2W53_004642 [Senna tora]|uniref:Uncharacterized protein n=1 Tax=Senna tora TaxID=362788 RepID=A0A834XDJ5_9FABA|nr:uncharacterized protein G2W53_004642 [Senna tora]